MNMRADIAAVLPEIVLLVGAVGCLLLGSWTPRRSPAPRPAARRPDRPARGSPGRRRPARGPGVCLLRHRGGRRGHRGAPPGGRRRPARPARPRRRRAAGAPTRERGLRPAPARCRRRAAARGGHRPRRAGGGVPAGQHPPVRPDRPVRREHGTRGRDEDLPGRRAVGDLDDARRRGPLRSGRHHRLRRPRPGARRRARGGGGHRGGAAPRRAALQGRSGAGALLGPGRGAGVLDHHGRVPDHRAQARRGARRRPSARPPAGRAALGRPGRGAGRGQHDGGQPRRADPGRRTPPARRGRP